MIVLTRPKIKQQFITWTQILPWSKRRGVTVSLGIVSLWPHLPDPLGFLWIHYKILNCLQTVINPPPAPNIPDRGF